MSIGFDTQKSIIVTTEFEGTHFYAAAPEEVKFLAHPHRHIFKVKAELEVFHDDRELEFIIVKRDLQKFCERWFNVENCGSCEMIGNAIVEYLSTRWGISLQKKIELKREYMHRKIIVEVWEDNENGARVVYEPQLEV